MFYEHFANLKSRFDYLRYKNQVFTPAGTTPISAPAEEKPSLLESLKSFNLKSLSFETKRYVILGVILVFSLIAVATLNTNFAAFRARRAASSSSSTAGDPDAWDKFINRERNYDSLKPIDTEPNDATTFQESMLQ